MCLKNLIDIEYLMQNRHPAGIMMTPASTSPAAVQLQSAFHEEEDERVSLLAQQPHKQAVERIITSIKQAGHIPCIYHSYELAGEVSIITFLHPSSIVLKLSCIPVH